MKENQKIKCVNCNGQHILKSNHIYTVLKDNGERVYINEHKRFSFLKNRFEVVNE